MPTAIKTTLERIELPPGFKIELYAIVPDARHMAVGPQGIVTFVGTRKDKVWAVTDRNKDRKADEVKDFAPSLQFTIPNGVCFSPDGFLYVAEQNRVLVFPAAEFFYESPDVAIGQVVPQGELIPRRRGELQPHGAGLRHRAGRQALHLARAAPQRAAGGEAGSLRRAGHRRDHPHEHRRRRARGLHPWHPELGRPGLRPPDRRSVVHRQPGRRHGRRHSAGRDQPSDRDGSELRLPLVWRWGHPHQRIQGRGAARGRGLPGGRDGSPCGRPRDDVLHRRHVPRSVQERHLLGAAWLVEPDRRPWARG